MKQDKEMAIIGKIRNKSKDLYGSSAPMIAFLGDSVTQGCFELFVQEDKTCDTVFEPESSYASRTIEILEFLFPRVSVPFVNAGISGDTAQRGAARLAKDILRFHPDLTVVCYGLNDCSGGMDYLKTYRESLENIFCRLRENGSEVIFMTPNRMNSRLDPRIREEEILAIARNTMEIQRNGVFDRFVEAGRQTAKECGVTICDVYEKWTRLFQSGVDTTDLLSNGINHPIRKMHYEFAHSLVEVMFGL